MTDTPRHAQWPKKLTASNAAQFSACPGSANLPAAIPGWIDPVITAEAASSKGEYIHSILAMAAGLPRQDMSRLIIALQYLEALRTQRNYKVLIEEKVEADWLPTPVHTTSDVVLYLQDELHIIDWKTGAIAVDAFDNDQLMFYAASYAYLAPKAKGAYLHIVQPWTKDWDDSVAVVYVSAQDIEQFMQRMITASQRVNTGDLTLTPGDHCTFCPANPHVRGPKGSPSCPAMMAVLYPERVELQNQLLEEEEEWFD